MKIADLNTAVEILVEAIKTDYRGWLLGRKEEVSDVRLKMISEFERKVVVEEGRKYLKIVKDNSVWGFIVKTAEGKFKAGDILKAASWASPVKNAARGNVFDGYTVSWTGPNYLK
jgi:hypothetical protein